MDIRHIGDLLKRYEKLIGARTSEIQVIIDVVNVQTGITLSKEQISKNSKGISIKASPSIRQKIFMYKKKILQALDEQGVSEHDIN